MPFSYDIPKKSRADKNFSQFFKTYIEITHRANIIRAIGTMFMGTLSLGKTQSQANIGKAGDCHAGRSPK